MSLHRSSPPVRGAHPRVRLAAPTAAVLRAAPFAVAAMGLGAFALPAFAQTQAQERAQVQEQSPHSPALDRISLSVGAFSAKPEVGMAVGNHRLHYDTGMQETDRKTMPRISGEFLLGRNHGISMDVYRVSQGYDNQFAYANASGPYSFSAMGGLNMDFSLDVARLGYRYWFGSGNTVFGVGAGLGYYRVKLNTTAYGAANAGLGSLGFYNWGDTFVRTDSDDAIAPMLEVGVRHAFSPDLRVFFDGSGIRKGGGGVHGSIYNAALGIEWFPVRNVGVSLAYAVTDVDLKRDDSGLQRLRVKFQGPVLGLKARF